MEQTRRSTRQSTATLPRYNEDSTLSAEEDGSKRNPTKRTRSKRDRAGVGNGEKDVENCPPPAKKVATSKTDIRVHNPLKYSKAAQESKPAKHKASALPALPTDTNHNPSGDQQVFWLLKAEPLPRFEKGVDVSFSIDSLAACTAPEPWSGVRNPQARNNMRAMRVGDLGFFYHSNAKPSGVAGILRVVEEAKVDETAFDSKDPYYDMKSKIEEPKWWCVSVEFVRKFEPVVSLEVLKREAAKGGVLREMQVVHNSRLSVCRVTKEEWDFVLGLVEEMKDKAIAKGRD